MFSEGVKPLKGSMLKSNICKLKLLKLGIYKSLILGGLSLSLLACTTVEKPRVNDYGVVTSGDFTFMEKGIKTYSWHSTSNKAYLSSKYNQTQVTDLVRQSIQKELSAHGFQLKENNVVGDMVVGFGLTEESILSDEQIFEAIKLSTGVPFYDGDGKLAEKGSMYIFIMVPNNAVPQWQAFAQAALKDGNEIGETKNRLDHFINKLFKNLPHI